MDLEPIVLPAAPAPPRRQPVPILAAIVPVAAGVVLWLVTGSILSLCFAAIGPLMIGASLLDGVRGRRRERRETAAAEEAGWRTAEDDLRLRHEQERAELRRSHPDAAGCLRERPLRDLQPVDESTPVVVGAGERRSSIRVSGGDGEKARMFRERSSRVRDIPIVVPMGRGLCIRGPEPVAAAVARAIVVQLCLRHAPAQFALSGSRLAALGLEAFPHTRRASRGAWVLGVGDAGEERADVSAGLWLCPPEGEVPEGITTVIDCVDPQSAHLRTASGRQDIALECLSRPQAVAVAEQSAQREGEVTALPDTVAVDELQAHVGISGLDAVVGRGEHADLVLDLVEDGPHAVVTGMTGTGKSELLVTWITAMAHAHGPHEVTFVLADFKGGTAFDPLRALPHVAAVITDLDDDGARRGVESLTAELRRREAVLAAAGVRDIADARVDLPRLVIVVDEFAALLQEHPDLGAVFTDVAARGRALGMHLILGTQRAAGVIRDALAANCPLRVSLRVSDAADSRLVIGSDDAAELPGGAASRGLAFIRRPQDTRAVLVRVALTGAADLRRIGAHWPDAAPSISPWLPPLPATLPVAQLDPEPGSVVIGQADEPERQRQPVVSLRPGVDRGMAIIGGSGSGRSSAIRLLAHQRASSMQFPSDPEAAWDALSALGDPAIEPPDLVLCDDLDRLAAAFPAEYAQAFLERMEQFVRTAAARSCTVVITTGRVSGPVARVVEALPSRLLLRTGTKLEHLAAGGEVDGYRRDRPAGRARWDGREVQIAWVHEGEPVRHDSGRDLPWDPGRRLVGVVCPGIRRSTEALRTEYPRAEIVPVGGHAGEAPAVPAVFVGDADSWQRQWSLWQRIRSEGEMLVLAECAAELRSLAGIRELPPFARPHAGRAWSVREGRAPRRVVIEALAPGAR